jgi:hypothetical protein
LRFRARLFHRASFAGGSADLPAGSEPRTTGYFVTVFAPNDPTAPAIATISPLEMIRQQAVSRRKNMLAKTKG